MLDTTDGFKNFARLHPVVFALLCWVVIALLLVLSSLFMAPTLGSLLDPILTLIFALALLARLGWLRQAGFRRPDHWKDLLVLWPAILFTLLTLAPLIIYLPHITSLSLAAFAVLVALLAGLNEEAMFRGLLLQSLRPLGLFAAATLSALLFALVHLNNLLHIAPSITLPQVIYAFLFGFAYAAFRLRTKVIWPLMIMHGCNDIAINVLGYATGAKNFSSATTSSNFQWVSTAILIVITLALAIYGFFLLRTLAKETQAGDQQKISLSQSAS